MKARRRRSASLTLRMLQQQTSYASWSKSYQLSVERAYQHLTDYFRDAQVRNITAAKISHYLSHRITVDLASPATATSELEILKSSIRKADALHDLPHQVIKDLLHVQPPQRRRAPRQPHFLTALQASAFLLHTPAWLQGPILTMLYAGLRPSEVIGLRWYNLNDDAQALYISSRKDCPSRSIPLPHLLLILFRELRAHSTHASHIFVDGKGNPLTRRIVAAAFRHASQEAELSHLRLSDMRNTFAGWALRAGIPMWTLSRMMGAQVHRSTIMSTYWEGPLKWDAFEPSVSSQSNHFLDLANRIVTNPQQYNAFLVSLFSRVSRSAEPSSSKMGGLRIEPSVGQRAAMHRLEGGTAN